MRVRAKATRPQNQCRVSLTPCVSWQALLMLDCRRAARAVTQTRQSEEPATSPQPLPAVLAAPLHAGLNGDSSQPPLSLLSRPPLMQANIPFYQLDPPQTMVSFGNPHTQAIPLQPNNNPVAPLPNAFPAAQMHSTGPSPLSTISSHNHPSAAPRLDVTDYLDPPLPTLNGIGGTTTAPDHAVTTDQPYPSPADNPGMSTNDMCVALAQRPC